MAWTEEGSSTDASPRNNQSLGAPRNLIKAMVTLTIQERTLVRTKSDGVDLSVSYGGGID